MPTNTAGSTARNYHKQLVHYLRKQVTFADEGDVVDVGTIPANAIVIGGGVMITTAFNDTATIDVGFRGGSTTDDPNGYATALVATAVGFKALDELAATTNIMQTSPAIVTASVNDGTGAVSAGVAEVIITFVLDNDQ
ncbi:hypothetical protein [Shinella fusca]|uniref:Uncharacterized protein n=1 Tax=Shinella fusca TaxID=544480 RepID=A0A7W7YR39_9HYPH|nr:hypothetical protein [Shinella fusca]MBB5040808.1 hypothetical protein [Shinella fusca]